MDTGRCNDDCKPDSLYNVIINIKQIKIFIIIIIYYYTCVLTTRYLNYVCLSFQALSHRGELECILIYRCGFWKQLRAIGLIRFWTGITGELLWIQHWVLVFRKICRQLLRSLSCAVELCWRGNRIVLARDSCQRQHGAQTFRQLWWASFSCYQQIHQRE